MTEAGDSLSSLPCRALRIGALRVLAAAHIVVGLVELASIAVNIVLDIGYTGGLLGLEGALTIPITMFLNSLHVASSPDPNQLWFKSQWIVRIAQSNHFFFVGMVAVHFVLGVVNLILGHGLWHRRRWARYLEIAVVCLAGLLAEAHGATLLWVGKPWADQGFYALITSVIVAIPIVTFLMLPGTAALFREVEPETQAGERRRPWWLLSLQMFAGLLALTLALGLLLLISEGPMVEVAWALAHLSTMQAF